MGVPAFFKWLSKKYPLMIVDCVEEKAKHVDGKRIPVDTTQPNPNGEEFDNLYLDMNGIMNLCCYPKNTPAPESDDEIMDEIFSYIDRLISIVRPRKLLYMAIDGVAPLAKINQKRSRQFINSKIRREEREAEAKNRSEIRDSGRHLPPKPKEYHPGKTFLFRQPDYFRYYVTERLNNDPGWKNIKVILSDANTPGEGEHKIIDYIRKQRANPDHDPNTHHCVYGTDTDLIMLGLATHEVNFTIIREEFKPNQKRACRLCYQEGHEWTDCQGLDAPPEERAHEPDPIPVRQGAETKFKFLRLNILKEYLEKELWMTWLPFTFDLDRAIDDWVFLCFFLGNDYLPYLPTLRIREGAIGWLIGVYKKALRKTEGFLTENGEVNLERVQQLMTDLGEAEDEMFKKWRVNDLDFRKETKERKIMPANAADTEEEEDEDRDDTVRLWEGGWKERYYQNKLQVPDHDDDFRAKLVQCYVEGLCWVLRYYYQGCASWEWYFPYHYAPFASDFLDIAKLHIAFDKGTKPLKPLEQQMIVGVNKRYLPETWRSKMTDDDSPIYKFFPENFPIDLNGNKYASQGRNMHI